MLYFSLLSFENHLKFYRNFVQLFPKNLKIFIQYDSVFFSKIQLFFVYVHIGINPFTTSFNSNTCASASMDEMVCYLCCTYIFGIEHRVLYSISFTFLYDSHLCSDDFCSTWCFVSIFVLEEIILDRYLFFETNRLYGVHWLLCWYFRTMIQMKG
jgi:hypothetical protein